MKIFLPAICCICLSIQLYAQDFTGQWKGRFIDKSTSFSGWGGDQCDYVLELECSNNKVYGYSYTYFSDGGKKYYTICKLTGTINKGSKSVEVTEIERTKTNVPVNIRNCFQIHRLTFFQHGDEQTLEGTWVPVPNQNGDCGYGTTVLSRRLLQKNPAYFNNTTTKTGKKTAPVSRTDNGSKTNSPVAKLTKPAIKPGGEQKPVVKKEPEEAIKKPVEEKTEPAVTAKTNNLPVPERNKLEENRKPPRENFEKRSSELIKTIEIDSTGFTVDLYDNGEVDGDSISLFFNGALILSHKRLSEKPITVDLHVDETREINELIMYADNLGSIPPNTALMVVHDGDNRYEVRISSDLQKSGVIRFVHRRKGKQ